MRTSVSLQAVTNKNVILFIGHSIWIWIDILFSSWQHFYTVGIWSIFSALYQVIFSSVIYSCLQLLHTFMKGN